MKKIILFLILLCPLIINAKTFNDFDTIKSYSSLYLATLKDSDKYLETNDLPFIYNNGVLTISNDFKKSGLINIFEYLQSRDERGNTYLNNGLDYWTMTNNNNQYYVIDTTKKDQYVLKNANEKSGYRPTVYIKSNVEFDGSGSYLDPWTFRNPGYRIIFDVNGGDEFNSSTCTNLFLLDGNICSKNVKINDKYGILPVPVKKYYTFTGWKNEKGELVNDLSVFTENTNITLYAQWELKNTGVPDKKYVVGEEVQYAGLDWYVVTNTATNVTLISKNNVSESSYGSTSKWNNSSVNAYLNNTWMQDNEVVYANYLSGNLVKNTTSKTFIRLILTGELKTSMKNGSGTNFWTMTASGSKVYYAQADATLKYSNFKVDSSATCYIGNYTSYVDSKTALNNISRSKQKTSVKSSAATTIVPTATEARINGKTVKTVNGGSCLSKVVKTEVKKYTCEKYAGNIYDTKAEADAACEGTKGYACVNAAGTKGYCYSDESQAENECSGQELRCITNYGDYYYGYDIYEVCSRVCYVGLACGFNGVEEGNCRCRNCAQQGESDFHFGCSKPRVSTCYMSYDPHKVGKQYTYSYTATASGTATTYDSYEVDNEVYSALGVRPVLTVLKK